MTELVGEAVIELRADMDRLRRDVLKQGQKEGDRFGNVFSKSATKRLRGIGESFKNTGVAVGTILTAASAVGPAVLAVGSALSAAAAGATALIGAIGPAAAAGAAAYAGALLAVKSATLLVKFAASGMGKALSGDAAALAALPPSARQFATSLRSMKDEMGAVRSIAASRIFADLGPTTQKLGKLWLPELSRAAALTGDAINGLAKQGAKMISTGPWRKDFATVAKSNAQNIGLFGRAGLQVADAARSIFVAAQPLIHTFAQWTLSSAKAFNTMIQGARKSGALADFFHTAATNAALLGDIIGNVAVGLFNVFKIGGAGQGRSMLVTLKGITAEFRAWTSSSSGASKIAGWFQEGRDNLAAMGRLLRDVSAGFASIGAGGQFAPLVDEIRTQVLPPLIDFLHNASASGALNSLVDAVGKLLNVFANLSGADSSLKSFAVTLGALASAAEFILNTVPGASQALGAFFIVVGARQAASLLGLGGAVNALGAGMGSLATKARLATGAQQAANGSLATFSQNMGHATGVLSSSAAGLGAATTRFQSLKAGARQAAGPAGILAIVAASSQSNHALRILGSVAGGVAAGFSVGGVWGAAIGGVIGLLATFRHHTGLTAEAQKRLRDAAAQVASTLDRETGSITRATRAAANKALADNGVYDAARRLNIPLHTVLRAYLGNADAAGRVGRIIKGLTTGVLPKHIAQTDKQRAAQQKAARAMEKMAPDVDKVTGAIGDSNGALGKQRRHLQQQREAADRSTAGTHRLGGAFHDAQDRASSMGQAADRAAKRIRGIPDHANVHFSTPGLAASQAAVAAYVRRITALDGRHVDTVINQRINTTGGKPKVEAPGSAVGRTHWKGGWSWVGEQGPELVRMPAGAQVIPHQQSVDFAKQQPMGRDVSFNVFPPTDDVEATATMIMNRMVTAGAFG